MAKMVSYSANKTMGSKIWVLVIIVAFIFLLVGTLTWLGLYSNKVQTQELVRVSREGLARRREQEGYSGITNKSKKEAQKKLILEKRAYNKGYDQGLKEAEALATEDIPTPPPPASA